MLDILVVDESREIALLLTLFEQARGVIHQDHQMAQLEHSLPLGVLLLDGDVIFAILQEKVQFDVLQRGLVDETADIVFQLVHILSLVLVSDFSQLLSLDLSVFPLENYLILVQFSIQFFEDEDKPSSEILYLALALLHSNHELHAPEEATAVVQQIDCCLEADYRC